MSGKHTEPSPSSSSTYQQEKWELVAEGDWLVGQRFEISRHAVLGRDSTCDITIPGTHLSRRHAELAVKGGNLLIRDLNSSNGTYINDQRVTETALNPGDSVRFDVLRFKVYGPSKDAPAVDSNATKIRQPASPRPRPTKTPPQERNWKTKPTAVGNRDKTQVFSTNEQAASHLWTVLAVILGLAAIAGLGYLVTYL